MTSKRLYEEEHIGISAQEYYTGTVNKDIVKLRSKSGILNWGSRRINL